MSLISYKVCLTYFKSWNGLNGLGGKYYAEGSYVTELEGLWEIIDEVAQMKAAGSLPGLAAGASNYHVLINVPDHPMECPHLLVHPLAVEPST